MYGHRGHYGCCVTLSAYDLSTGAAYVAKKCSVQPLGAARATLALEEGATSEAIARALGHTSFSMTAKHYVSPDSLVNARVARAGPFLTPKEPEPPVDEVSSLLSRLSLEQREQLRALLVTQ